MTMILRLDPRADALGAIEVDEDGRVRRVLGEGPAPEVAVTRCMFTGVYVLSPDIREDLPDVGCIVRHSLRRWLARGDRVSAVIDRGPWFDLGTIDAYAQATFGLLDGSIALDRVERAASRQRVAASARCDRAKITLGDYVDVGDEAQIDGEGALARAIVWDRSRLAAPASDVIVTTGGVRVAIA
jgi:NDP-sugar pyrophosphorylase family protein